MISWQFGRKDGLGGFWISSPIPAFRIRESSIGKPSFVCISHRDLASKNSGLFKSQISHGDPLGGLVKHRSPLESSAWCWKWWRDINWDVEGMFFLERWKVVMVADQKMIWGCFSKPKLLVVWNSDLISFQTTKCRKCPKPPLEPRKIAGCLIFCWLHMFYV